MRQDVAVKANLAHQLAVDPAHLLVVDLLVSKYSI
jgi:hypothetical protein